MKRELLIKAIKKHDPFYKFVNFDGHSDLQLEHLHRSIKADKYIKERFVEGVDYWVSEPKGIDMSEMEACMDNPYFKKI